MNWRNLAASLAAQLQIDLGEVDAIAMHGGDINRAFRLQGRRHCFFVKINRADRLSMFEAERAGLDAMRATRTIRVPEVFSTGADGESAYIVMEYIELGGRPGAGRLAIALSAMHASLHDRFGFHCDNTIGSTPQPNPFCDDWIEFWRRHRLEFQLGLARERGFEAALIDAGARLGESIPNFFAGYRPKASLLHGDLWSGNQGADAEGNPVIYDPACYYGDHEADLAMMELFGHPGERFFSVYDERFAIDAGYNERRDLYNLYHIFNHALLFGGGYLAQTRQTIERLLAQV